MEKLNKLYKRWLNEKNKGHYKDGSNIENDVLKIFGCQDQIVNELEQLFKYNNIELKGNILDIGCSMGGLYVLSL